MGKSTVPDPIRPSAGFGVSTKTRNTPRLAYSLSGRSKVSFSLGRHRDVSKARCIISLASSRSRTGLSVVGKRAARTRGAQARDGRYGDGAPASKKGEGDNARRGRPIRARTNLVRLTPRRRAALCQVAQAAQRNPCETINSSHGSWSLISRHNCSFQPFRNSSWQRATANSCPTSMDAHHGISAGSRGG